MARLTIENTTMNDTVSNNIDINAFLESHTLPNIEEFKNINDKFKSIINNNNINNYEEIYNNLYLEAETERRKKTDAIVDEFISSFDMFDGSLINNGITIDIISDMKERLFNSYDYETKTVAYVGNKRLSLVELYNKYRQVDIEEQNEYTNAELCQDIIRYIDPEILNSSIDGMNRTVEDYLTNTLPTLMHEGTNVEIDGSMIPLQIFVKKIVDHQCEYLNELKEQEEIKREEELNRTNENPNLVGLINVAIKANDSLEVTTEMPILQACLLTNEETESLNDLYTSNKENTTDYYYKQISKLKTAIYKTTNEHNLAYDESILNDLISNIKEDEYTDELRTLISSTKDLVTQKRNGFIKLNINNEDLIDITHGIINEWINELATASSSDEFNKLYGNANGIYLDLTSKGVKDIQLDAKIISFLNNLEKKRIVFDSTLTNISPEIQQIKFDLDEQMKRIRQEILSIECNKTELNQLSGKIIMISHLIDKAKTDVLNASHDHRFSDYNNKFTNDSLNYYLSQLDMYDVALDNMNKIGYGYR
jgi:hypothetical protein